MTLYCITFYKNLKLSNAKAIIEILYFKYIFLEKMENLLTYLSGDSLTGVLLESPPFKFTSSNELSGNFKDKHNLE